MLISLETGRKNPRKISINQEHLYTPTHIFWYLNCIIVRAGLGGMLLVYSARCWKAEEPKTHQIGCILIHCQLGRRKQFIPW